MVQIPLLVVAGDGGRGSLSRAAACAGEAARQPGIGLLAGTPPGPWVDLAGGDLWERPENLWQQWFQADSPISFPSERDPFCDLWCVATSDEVAGIRWQWWRDLARQVKGESVDGAKVALLFRPDETAPPFLPDALNGLAEAFDHILLLDVEDENGRCAIPGQREGEVANLLAAVIRAAAQEVDEDDWPNGRLVSPVSGGLSAPMPARFGTAQAARIEVDRDALLRRHLAALLPDPDSGSGEEPPAVAEGEVALPSGKRAVADRQRLAIAEAGRAVVDSLPRALHAEEMRYRLAREARGAWEGALGACVAAVSETLWEAVPRAVAAQDVGAEEIVRDLRRGWAGVARYEGLVRSMQVAAEAGSAARRRIDAGGGGRDPAAEEALFTLEVQAASAQWAGELVNEVARVVRRALPRRRQVFKAAAAGGALITGGVAMVVLFPTAWRAAMVVGVAGVLPFGWWRWRLHRGRRRLAEVGARWCEESLPPRIAEAVKGPLRLAAWRGRGVAARTVEETARRWCEAVEGVRKTLEAGRAGENGGGADDLDDATYTRLKGATEGYWQTFLRHLDGDGREVERVFEDEFLRPMWGEVGASLDLSAWPPDRALDRYLDRLIYAVHGGSSLHDRDEWWLVGDQTLADRLSDRLEARGVNGQQCHHRPAGDGGLWVVRLTTDQTLAALGVEQEIGGSHD